MSGVNCEARKQSISARCRELRGLPSRSKRKWEGEGSTAAPPCSKDTTPEIVSAGRPDRPQTPGQQESTRPGPFPACPLSVPISFFPVSPRLPGPPPASHVVCVPLPILPRTLLSLPAPPSLSPVLLSPPRSLPPGPLSLNSALLGGSSPSFTSCISGPSISLSSCCNCCCL